MIGYYLYIITRGFMTFRHLEIFVKVAETLNMTATAELLFIAQPSVSQSVSELEQHLNTRLFERLGRRLTLTADGDEFLSYARHIVSLGDEAERKMRDRQRGGSIRIGGSMTVGTTVLNPVVKKFMEEIPGCGVTITVDNTSVLEKMILADKIDIAFAEGNMKSDFISSRVVMDDELLLICSATHRFSGMDYVPAGELAGESFILREEGSGTGELFLSVMSSNNIGYKISGVMNNAEAIKLAVADGIGISVMSELSVRREVKRGELSLSRIEGVNFHRQFSVFHHRNKFMTPAIEKFFELCEDL